jgi:hypothetical protein
MTYAEYTAMLSGLTVSGVAKRFTAAPAQLSTANLPAQWPRLPQGNTEVSSLDGGAGLTTFVCDLVVAVEAVGQSTQPANWTKALQLIDAMQTAIVAEAAGNHVIDKWALRLAQDQIGDTVYWLIVATVTGSN